MRTRATEHLLRSALGLALILGAGLTGSRVHAQVDCTNGGDSCTNCQHIFDDAGLKLREHMASVGGCCDNGCDGDVCCDDVCCDSCDWCCLGEPWALQDVLFDDYCGCPPFTVGGWTQFGVHTRPNGMFNNHDRRFHLHQGYLYAERVADGSCGTDWGFRADILYGIDAQDTQAFGGEQQQWDSPWDNGVYGWAIPQLYAEVASGDTSVKFGKFYTLVGYEVVTAPDNFFYSHAYTMYNSEPFTHTGVLVTQNVSDDVTVYGGWVDGWDTGFEFSGGSQFLGGVSMAASDNVTVTYILMAGDREVGGGVPFQGNAVRSGGYNHSVVVDIAMSDNLNYIIQSDFVDYNEINQHQYGINQYLIYWYNDCLGFGARGEWWHTNEERVGLGPGGSEDLYQFTLGMNIRPHANLIMRPEVRWDWDQNGAINGLDGVATFGFDAIFTF